MGQEKSAIAGRDILHRKKRIAAVVMLVGLLPSLTAFYVCQSHHRDWARELAALRVEAYREADKELAKRDAAALGELSEPEMTVNEAIAAFLNRGGRLEVSPEGKLLAFRVKPTPEEDDFFRKNKALAIGLLRRLPQDRAAITDLLPDWAGGDLYTGNLDNPENSDDEPPGRVARDQSEAWAWRTKVLPVLVEAFFALPWFWYFTLARIAELSIAVRGGR